MALPLVLCRNALAKEREELPGYWRNPCRYCIKAARSSASSLPSPFLSNVWNTRLKNSSSAFGMPGGKSSMPLPSARNDSMYCVRISRRKAGTSAGDGSTTPRNSTAISFLVSSPQVTGTGGCEGLCGLFSELSYTYSSSMRVPCGRCTGSLLPVEIPILDPDQVLDASIRQNRIHLHVFAEIVRVGRDAEYIHIPRHGHGSLHHVVRISGGDRNAPVGKDDARAPFGGRRGELQTERGLILLGLAGRVIVDLHDDVGALPDELRKAGRIGRRRGARCPTAEQAHGRKLRAAEAGVAAIRGIGRRVGKEGKWRHLAGAMASRAVLIQNRRDVFVECGHGGVGFSDCAAQRAGSRMGDRPPGQYRVERVAQIELGGLQARLPEILHLIVDAPQIQHRAIGGEHHGFRRHRGAGVTGQNLPRVEQSGKAVSVFARVPPDFFVGNRGVALHRIEEHATRGVRLFDAVHLRRVAVAQGAIRGDEEEHYGARLGPLIRVVLDALGIAQGKLERGTR